MCIRDREWGAQRIKGLSLKGVVLHFLKKTFGQKKPGDIAQKKTETSLIEKFLYPKFGPGQLWELSLIHISTWPCARPTMATRMGGSAAACGPPNQGKAQSAATRRR